MRISSLNKIFEIDKVLKNTFLFKYWLICRRAIFQYFTNRTGTFVRKNNFGLPTISTVVPRNVLLINNPKFEQRGELDPWMKSIKESIADSTNVSVLSNCLREKNVIPGDIFLDKRLNAPIIIFHVIKIIPNLILLTFIIFIILKRNPVRILKHVIYANASFHLQYQKVRTLLKKIDVETVYLTDGISNLGIIKACNSQAIRVVEVQHGLCTSRIPNYHFEVEIPKPSLFPDEILFYSPSWKNSYALPMGVQIGHFKSDKLFTLSWLPLTEEVSPSIVFIGQRSHMEYLLNDILSLNQLIANSDVKCSLILIPHPSDVVEKYERLFEDYSNISVLKSDSRLSAWPSAFVGAYSTTIFELLHLKKPVFVKDIFIEFLGSYALVFGLNNYKNIEYLFEKIQEIDSEGYTIEKQDIASVFSDNRKESVNLTVS